MTRRTFRTRDDVTLAGRRWLAEHEPRASVVLVHGFTASADHRDVVAVAETLHTTGLDVVSYDARGHGRSESHSTLGDLERHDVAAAVAVARERSDRVVLVGASMGAIAVVRYAVEDPDLAGVVSVSCPARWRLPRSPLGVLSAGMTRTGLGRALAARHLNVRIAPRWTNPTPPVDLVDRIRVPLALVHGTRDRFISPADARELHAKSGAPTRLIEVTGMGHAFAPESFAVISDAVDWALSVTTTPA
ncbi:MAG: alpha/beta fold hydrolase [Acidimicrobiia bacterium]